MLFLVLSLLIIKWTHLQDNVLRLRKEREGNQASAESHVDETTLYIEAASGAKKRNLYGAGSKRVDYIKDKDSGNETTGITKVNDGWEKKSMKMERKLNKLNKTLEIVCNRFNITLPDCDLDSENTDGGDAHQGPNTSNSRAVEDEVAKVFRIDTNIFNFETPMCKTFKEFNYLLQIDQDLLTKDIEGFKTYEEYKDDWIYEWYRDVPWVDEKPWTDTGNDGYCNGGNLPRAYIVGNSLHYQDSEWYEALKDSELKEQALRNKAIMEGLIIDDESSNDGSR
ncbi:hypothetical protein Tco_0633736 [Tanacetum coccineum]